MLLMILTMFLPVIWIQMLKMPLIDVDCKVDINADPEGNGQTDFDVSADNDTEGDNDTNVVASDPIEAVVEVSDGVFNCV